MFVKPLSILLLTISIHRVVANPPPATPPALKEADLVGLYLQVNTGTLLEFHPGGRLTGWPSSGTYKIVGENQLEIKQSLPNKEDESLPIKVFRQEKGLIISRRVEGKDEIVPLHRLHPAKLDGQAWQGDCMIHVLISGKKLATKRESHFTEDGYLRTPEGGYWLRLVLDKDGKQALGFTSELEDQTIPVQIFKTGPLLVVFDLLEKPALLSIIQLSVK